MRLRVLLVALMLLPGGAVIAQEKPPMDLPVYPGGETTMEVNLTQDDLLPTIQAMLPMLSGQLGKYADKINVDDLAAVLKDVKRIEVVTLDVAKPTVTEAQVIAFYSKNLPKGESWSRMFWQSAPKVGTVAVFTQPGMESLYAFRVRTVIADDKRVKRVEVLKTEGKIDFAKLLTIAVKFVQ